MQLIKYVLKLQGKGKNYSDTYKKTSVALGCKGNYFTLELAAFNCWIWNPVKQIMRVRMWLFHIMNWFKYFQENYGNSNVIWKDQMLPNTGFWCTCRASKHYFLFQSGVDCTEEVSSLFRGELNPVATKAQKKVQIPEGFVQAYLLLFFHFAEYYKTQKYNHTKY